MVRLSIIPICKNIFNCLEMKALQILDLQDFLLAPRYLLRQFHYLYFFVEIRSYLADKL